jgi:hypothetical protein
MRNSKTFVNLMNAMNEEIADQTQLIDLIKTIMVSENDETKPDLLDREMEKLFKMVHFKNELADMIRGKEEKGEL